jgi:hypothetical protein
MPILKTALAAASLCAFASFAHADSSVPVQGLMSWDAGKSAYASQQPRMTAKTSWHSTKAAAPFSREAAEEKSGH